MKKAKAIQPESDLPIGDRLELEEQIARFAELNDELKRQNENLIESINDLERANMQLENENRVLTNLLRNAEKAFNATACSAATQIEQINAFFED